MDGRQQDSHRVVVLEREHVREVARAAIRLAPTEVNALALSYSRDESVKRCEGIAHARSWLGEDPPLFAVEAPVVCCSHRPHPLFDDLEGRRPLPSLFESSQPEVDNPAARALLGFTGNVIADQIGPNDIAIVSLWKLNQFVSLLGSQDEALPSRNRSLECTTTVLRERRRGGDVEADGPKSSSDSFDLIAVEHKARRLLSRILDPVHDADVDDSFPRPGLLRDCLRYDTAGLDDPFEALLARASLRDRVRGDQTSPAARLEAVVRLPEPVHGVVLEPDAELLLQPLRVGVPELAPDLLRAVVRRVADDRIRFRPLDLEGVVTADAGKIGERQDFLRQPQLVDGKRVAHPQRDSSELHGERLRLDSTQIA